MTNERYSNAKVVKNIQKVMDLAERKRDWKTYDILYNIVYYDPKIFRPNSYQCKKCNRVHYKGSDYYKKHKIFRD